MIENKENFGIDSSEKRQIKSHTIYELRRMMKNYHPSSEEAVADDCHSTGKSV